MTASSPKTVYQATTATLTLTGTGFTADATSSASFSDAGITVSSMTWLSSTQLSVSVAVASTATTGAGNVSVTTPGGTGTCTGCLNVDKPPPPSNTALPVISGTAQDGQALTTSNGTWSSKNTLTYAYQWQLCNSSGADCANILGATNDYFRLSSLDVGNEVTVVVTATDQVSQSTGATASPIGPVADPPPPSNTALPVISGTAQDGRVLTTSKGSWSSPDTLTYAYQWQLCNSSGTDCATILGATNDYFRLSTVDVGNKVTVVVTASDQEHQSTEASAGPIGPVTDPPPPSNTALPVISGTAQDGQVLTVSNGSWSSPDSLSYGFQWQLCNSSGTDCAPIVGATENYFQLAAADVGGDVTVVVTASDQEHQSTEASAGPIGPVTDPPPPSNSGPPVISGGTQAGDVVAASSGTWNSPDTLTYAYQWQLCNSSGTDCADILGATNDYYQLTSAEVGDEVTVVVTATDQENQSTAATAPASGPVTAA